MTAMGPMDPMAAQLNGGPPNVMVPEDRELVAQRLLAAVRAMADKAAVEENAAEAKDYAAAAKSLSDAYVVLDPMLDAMGVPVAHQEAMAVMEQVHKERLAEVNARRAAPGQERKAQTERST